MCDANQQPGSAETGDAPLTFLLLVLVLSSPFWAIGAVTRLELMPSLPVSGLMIVCPAIAALLLRWRQHGRTGMLGLLARAWDAKRLRSPFAIAALLLINPALFATAYLVQRGLGVALPAPNVDPLAALVLMAVFLVAALCEELGWTGYALEPLQRRWGAVRASVVIGAFWASWHVIPLLQADRALEWIAWWSLWTVSARILMVWLYNHTGRSVFGVALYHATSNVCWQTYPVQGSFFDPRVMAPVTLALAIALVLSTSLARSVR